MKIQILNLEGIHNREIKGLNAISQAFPKKWLGYASLELLRQQRGSREFDLIIVTGDRILAIEIKDWNGKLTSNGRAWSVNGKFRGKSPVLTMDKKAKILHSELRRLMPRIKFISSIPVDGLVVLTGSSDKRNLHKKEKKSVFNLDEFLKIPNNYDKYFPGIKTGIKIGGLFAYIQEFNQFFLGKNLFKPQEQTYQQHKIVGEPLYIHPNKLYKEYNVQDINMNTRALLRLWNLSTDTLPIDQNTQEARREIVEREGLVLAYLKDIKPELFENRIIVEQKNYQEADIVEEIYSEIYDLPINQDRLSQFINKTALNDEERISLIKFLLSNFADVHEANVAHRDLGQDCLWVNETKISFSGFMSSTLPNAKTIRSRLPVLKSNRIKLPEHELTEVDTDPFRQDVYLIGVASHIIAFSKPPVEDEGIFCWNIPEQNTFENYHEWFEKALSWEPSSRFANAREMLDSLNDISEKDANKVDFTFLIEKYRVKEVVMVKYVPNVLLKQPPPALIYRSFDKEMPVIVKSWPIQNIYEIEQGIELYNFFASHEKLKIIQSKNIPNILGLGIDSMNNLFIVQEYHDGWELGKLDTSISIEQRVNIALELIGTVLKLHEHEIYHRDIRPENIIIIQDKKEILYPVLIDIVEYGSRDYCQNYNPPDYEQISLRERDVYATSLVVMEVLNIKYKVENGVVEIEFHKESLENVVEILKAMTLPNKQERLPVFGSLIDELKIIIEPKKEEISHNVNVTLDPKAADPLKIKEKGRVSVIYNFDMVPDNGYYYVKYRYHEKRGDNEIYITGLNQELKIRFDSKEQNITRCWLNNIDYGDVVKASYPDYMFKGQILINIKNIRDLSSLNNFIKRDLVPNLDLGKKRTEIYEKDDDFDFHLDSFGETHRLLRKTEAEVDTSERWKTLIDVEENLNIEVSVSGEITYLEDVNLLIIPYDPKNVYPDFDQNDIVKAKYKTSKGYNKELGYLDLRRTNTENLYIRTKDPHFNKSEISSIILESMWQSSSFKRRSNATKRIIDKESVIIELIDIIDGRVDNIYENIKTFDETLLEQYFGDNKTQKNAFKKCLSWSPISLLQGPPGTGKTKFIAAFVHYLFNRENVRNILLVTQSHEAVNNLAETIIKQYMDINPNVNLDMVRVGAEGVISRSLLKYHTSGLREKYRNSFKAGFKKRISKAGNSLGLPPGLSKAYIEVRQTLDSISHKLKELNEIHTSNPNRANKIKMDRLRDTFYQIYNRNYKDEYGKTNNEPEEVVAALYNKIKDKYNVSSYPNLINKLVELILLGEEWIKVLESDTSGFEEFLVRTRPIVVGTCVGVGKPSLKIDKNIYDWVIIDEAARCNPGELAVSMQVGKNILLVGDHKQLPPMIEESIIEESSKKLGIQSVDLKLSEFQRLMGNDLGEIIGCTLDRQYRMCKPIADMISDIFYKHDGIKLITVRGENPAFYNFIPRPMHKQVTWIDTIDAGKSAYHRKEKNSESIYNDYEAEVIIKLLDMIGESNDFLKELKKYEKVEYPIGVVCPYTAQKKLLLRRIEKKAWHPSYRKLIKVDTVDSYQGKENQIIFVSLTRNDTKFGAGFLKYPERINVSLSRAKERLIIIGSKKMWGDKFKDKPLGKVYHYINSSSNSNHYGIVNSSELFDEDKE